jgi:hypothetical protein
MRRERDDALRRSASPALGLYETASGSVEEGVRVPDPTHEPTLSYCNPNRSRPSRCR